MRRRRGGQCCGSSVAPERQLAGAMDLWMRRQDLLRERRAGTQHAHDEHRSCRSLHRVARPLDPAAVVRADDEVDGPRQYAALMRGCAFGGQLVGTPIVAEGELEIADVVEVLP